MYLLFYLLLYLYVYLLIYIYIGSRKPELDCARQVQIGMKTELKCTCNTEHGILRLKNPQNKSVLVCPPRGTNCNLHVPNDDGKYNYTVNYNEYMILIINKFDKSDIGKWSCIDELKGPPLTCNILLQSKFIHLIERYDDYAAAADNSNNTHSRSNNFSH